MLSSHALNAMMAARDADELWSLHVRLMEDRGFDRLLYGHCRLASNGSLGDPQDFVVFSNHDPAYLKGFVEDGLCLDAPMFRWALENDGAKSWSALGDPLRAGAFSARERAVIEFNKSMHIVAGYTISFRSMPGRTKAVIALTACRGMSQRQVDALWEKDGEEILLLNNLFHLRLMSLPHAPPARALTVRQREVLEWIGDGKTVQDTALLMNLTAGTVEKHLRLARAALNVETTVQAVLKAALYNQIFAHPGQASILPDGKDSLTFRT